MIGREFTKKIKLLNGRHETIKTKFELAEGQLVEYVELETHDKPAGRIEVPVDQKAKRTR
jgi:hypothetical protein